MKQLSQETIVKLASGKNVKYIAVVNFLSTMGTNPFHASMNLGQDSRVYNWNAATIAAIKKGIRIAQGF